MDEEYKSLDALGQFIILVSAILGFIAIVLNLSCILKVVETKSFCVTSTGSQIVIVSLCGSNILVGITTTIKEILFIFLGSNLPKYWKHFESYIVAFCLISSSLHVLLISSLYLINTLRSYPYPLRFTGRVVETSIVVFVWMASLLPSSVKTDKQNYSEFLKVLSLGLLVISLLQLPILLLVLKVTQRAGGQSHSCDKVNFKSNLTKTRWLRYREKEKTLCIAFMASYLLCSCPYMIYYPVLSKVYVGSQKEDMIDDILFLFILGKCLCDAIIFIVRKGWKKDKRMKVNFQLQQERKSLSLPEKPDDIETVESAPTNV